MEIGRSITEGLAVGIGQAAEQPAVALGGIAASLPGNVPIGPEAPRAGQAPVVIHVHGNLIHERDVGGLVDRALAQRRRQVPQLAFEQSGLR
jgi:hypothetical protein